MSDSANDNTGYENLTPDHKPVPVVAIGGSAGGQRAVMEMLKHLPGDTGLGFVYIQHLSREYDSQLVPILAAVTPMPVMEATPLMQVQANHLYIIPPNTEMEIIDGVLVLTPRKAKPHISLPIDQFFISLAERQKDGAIGIVLSGMANDGTLGLKAIKVAGGVTFAQDETAEFAGMPQSAISEGVVDMVLSPKDIAIELIRLSKHADIFQLTSETDISGENDVSDKDLETILLFIKSSVGVDFGRYKTSTIRRRVIRRMLLYKLDTLKEYATYLKQHPGEASILYNDLLINVTSFFRDEQTMDYLKKEILPSVIKSRPVGEPIRFWVAACSTGQEAYSLAMMMIEILGDRAATVPIQIFATDLSEAAISKARLGTYGKSEIKEVSQRRLDRFFTKVDDQYRINKPVRDLCVFAPHNLLSDPPFSRLDMVTCRNLLIYLDDVLQKKALTTFHYALNPDGILVLGKSEAIGSSPTHFSQIQKEYKVFTRKNNALARIPSDMTIKKNSFSTDRKVQIVKSAETVPGADLDKLVDSWLLSHYVPASVIVDQDMEILQFRGATSLYLEHATGKASLNLGKMARPSLVFELRNAIHKARKTSQPEGKEGLEINVNGKVHHVNIKAVPITNLANQQLFLILFEEQPEIPTADGTSSVDASKRNQALESELAALRQDMHSIIEEQEASNEELQSANEEIVSSNEELQSINEELETSKEEIESANEELQTINQELQVRNDQLTESYEYSEAILSTIHEATLVLDNQLRIKGANKAFYKTFHADPNKTEGSMIYELGNRQLDFNGFREVMHNVITRDVPLSGYEVKMKLSDRDEKTMLVHARKVLLHQNQTILLVFEDITEHRKAQDLLRERQQWFEELVDNAHAFIWVSQPDGRVNYLNKAWLDFTGQSYEREKGNSLTESIHPDDRDQYLDVASKSIKERLPFSWEYRLRRRDGEYRWIAENSKPRFSPDGQYSGYVGTCSDIHLQKTLTAQLNAHVEERTKELKAANAELETANQELRQTADRLQSVLNGVPAAVTLMEAVYNESGEIADFHTSVYNERTLELTQQSAPDILDKTLLQWFPKFKDTGLFEIYKQVLITGETAYRELTGLPGLDGLTMAFLITRQVDLKGIVVTILDITTRKQAETKLITTAESLQAVLDSSPASIGFFKAIFDENSDVLDFTLIVCNRKFSRLFNRETKDLIGLLASDLYDEQQLTLMKKVLTSKEMHYAEVYTEAEQKWAGVSVSRHDHGVAVTQLDISSLKQAQSEQDELVTRLKGSFEMIESLSVLREYVQHRGSFLRSTFHDLRGSFGIISGATALLDLMDTDEDRKKTLDMIQRNLGQVTQMMNQLLDFSRLEAGQETLQISTFNAASLLTELCEGSAAMAVSKNLSIKFAGPEELIVDGDHVKVRRVAQNLLLNAIRYTIDGGVTMTWGVSDRAGDHNWQFVVEDTGPGISKKSLDKIHPLETGTETEGNLTDAETYVQKGEGIGLFIVKRLVELMHGSMNIATSDSGTKISITFPNKIS